MIKLIGIDFRRLLPHYWRGWSLAIFLGAMNVILTDEIWKGFLLSIIVGALGIVTARDNVRYIGDAEKRSADVAIDC